VPRRRPFRHVTFTLGAAITLALVATAALSLVYTPADPLAMSITTRLQGPTGGHPFGTDHFGRDVLSRVMGGASTSIAVGLIAVGIGAGAGMLLGVLAGYLGGWIDEVLMRRAIPMVRRRSRARSGAGSARRRRIDCSHANPLRGMGGSREPAAERAVSRRQARHRSATGDPHTPDPTPRRQLVWAQQSDELSDPPVMVF